RIEDNRAHAARGLQARGFPGFKGERVMKPSNVTALRYMKAKSWILVALLVAALSCTVAPRATAQMDGVINGQLLDVAGKPWADIPLTAEGDQGQKAEAKSDKDGNFVIRGLRSGTSKIMVTLPPPNQPYQAAVVQVRGAETPKVVINFKELVGKQSAEVAEQQKKAAEDKAKFTNMKQHFDAGIALLGQVNQAQAELQKAPADQRDALKTQVADLSSKAVTELEAAKSGAPEKDANLHLIWARLGDAYAAAGRPDDAANAYKQAVALKPTAAYYNNL